MTQKQKGPAWAATQTPGSNEKNREHYSDELPQSKCTVCNNAWPLVVPVWVYELDALAARLPEFGIGPDLAAICMCEAWGVYLFLSNQGA
jgi:hypothetical protein